MVVDIAKMGNPAVYTVAELASYQSHPALQPEVVITTIKQVYEKTLYGRQLLKAEQEQTDSVSWLEEGDIVGKVDWLSEKGGFPQLDVRYVKRAKPIRPYGTSFEVTMFERRFNKIVSVGRKIQRATFKMRRFEDDLIYQEIVAAGSTYDGSNWTDTSSGDPAADLEHAKTIIRDETEGMEPDVVIMPPDLYENLTKFDYVRNNLYVQARVLETGSIDQLAGLKIIVDPAVDPNKEGKAVVMKSKMAGYIAEAIPLTTIPKKPENPLIDMRYYLIAMTEPVIDHPELVVVLTGLKG